MKRINFLSTLSPNQQHALSRWVTLSIFCIGSLLLLIITLQTFQLITWYQVYQEKKLLTHKTNSFARTMEKKHEYTTKITTLTQCRNTLHHQKKQLQHIHTLCKTLIPTDPISLTTLIYQPHNIELTIAAPTPEHITTYAHTLTQNPSITSLDIVSLQPQKNTTTFNATLLIQCSST